MELSSTGTAVRDTMPRHAVYEQFLPCVLL